MTNQEMIYPSLGKEEAALQIIKDEILWQFAAKMSAKNRTETELHAESGEEIGG